MIFLTRLDGREVVVNSDLIVTVEATPDTMVTLSTGDRLLVRESVESVVDKAVAFRYRTLQGPGSRAAEPVRTQSALERARAASALPPAQQVSDTATDDASKDALPVGRGEVARHGS